MLQNALSKSLPNVSTLVRNLFNCHDNFLRLSEFPDLFGKVFWSFWNSPNLIFQAFREMKCKQNNFFKRFKRLLFLILALIYLYKLLLTRLNKLNTINFFYAFFKKLFKKLAPALFYCFSQQIRLADWCKLACIDQSRFCIIYQRRFKKNVT